MGDTLKKLAYWSKMKKKAGREDQRHRLCHSLTLQILPLSGTWVSLFMASSRQTLADCSRKGIC